MTLQLSAVPEVRDHLLETGIRLARTLAGGLQVVGALGQGQAYGFSDQVQQPAAAGTGAVTA